MPRKIFLSSLALIAAGLAGCVAENFTEAARISQISDAPARIAQMEGLNAKYPDDPNPYVYLSGYYLAAGQNDKAIAILDRALANPKFNQYTTDDFWLPLKQDPSKFHYYKGQAYANKGDHAKAIEEYDKAISLLTGILLKAVSEEVHGFAGDASGMGFWRKSRKDTAAADLETYYASRAFSQAAAQDCEEALADVAKAKEHLRDRDEYLATMNEYARTAPESFPPAAREGFNKYPDRRASGADFIRQWAAYHSGQEEQKMAKTLELLLKCQSGAGK